MTATEPIRPDAAALRTRLSAPAGSPPGADPDLEHVVEWLAAVTLLRGVPLAYLVPDVAMLPPESLRFFRIDQGWIDCLVDGAFGVGHSLVTTAAAGPARADVLARARQRAASLRSGGSVPEDAPERWSASGFLLRSAAVSGWPGVEITGYADVDAHDPLPIVRLESLGKNLLLCVFRGDVERVEFREPPEGIHFGVDRRSSVAADDLSGWQKEIRRLTSDGGRGVGEPVAGATVDVPVRSSSPTVVRVADLAAAFAARAVPTGGVFTAAEFGLEMVEPVPAVGYRLRRGGAP